jgi:hypothetical protein
MRPEFIDPDHSDRSVAVDVLVYPLKKKVNGEADWPFWSEFEEQVAILEAAGDFTRACGRSLTGLPLDRKA